VDPIADRRQHLSEVQVCGLGDEAHHPSGAQEGIMTNDHLDDDENVKMMRETARTIGLTQRVIDAYNVAPSKSDLEHALEEAMRLLGVSEEEREGDWS
jgi:hypothetical protein